MKTYIKVTLLSFIFIILGTYSSIAQTIQQGDSIFDVGSELLSENKNSDAIEQFKKALIVFDKIPDKIKIKDTRYMIAFCYAARLGDWVNAEIWLKKSLEAATETSDSSLIARINGNLGIIYDKTGRYALSADHHTISLSYYRKAGNTKRAMLTLKNIGMLYLNRSNYYFAKKNFNEAMAYAKKMGDSVEIGRLTYNLGLIQYKKGNYGKAYLNYQDALNILGKDIANIDKAELHNNIGTVYSEYGDTLKARFNYNMAFEIAKEMGHKDLQARILNNIGNLYLTTKNYKKAIEFFQKSVKLNETTGNRLVVSITYQNIGIAKQKQKDYEKAKEYFNKSKELKKSLGYLWGQSYLNLCQARLFIETGEKEKAAQMLDDALVTAKKLEADNIILQIYASEAMLHLLNGDTLSAIKKYEESIEVTEKIRGNIGFESGRHGYMETVIPTYKALVELKLKQGDKESAYSFYERMKTRNLLEILDGAYLVFDELMDEEDIIVEQQLNSELRMLDSEIKYLNGDDATLRSVKNIVNKKREYNQRSEMFRQKMLAKYPDLKNRSEAGTPANLQSAAKLLNENNETAVVYMVSEEKTYVFVLWQAQTGENNIEAIEIDLTKDEIKELGESIIKDWEIQKPQYLSDKLLKPIMPYLKNTKKLCIVPDSYLFSIPFHALPLPDSDKYLIEDYSVYYDYSLSILRELKAIKKSGKETVLAFGNPDFSRFKASVEKSNFSALPKSEEEVLSIQEIYSGSSKIFLNNEASETNFKQNVSDYNIIHLATHGLFNDVNPMYSSLLLTSGNGEDGYLSASEIIKMNVNSDLVVLSACETAKGIISDGEGMLGLSRAFLGAKVPTIIASLWQVDDRSTKLLMEQFYQNIRNKDDYATALQKAQLYMLKSSRYKNPFFWAPFIVIGDSK